MEKKQYIAPATETVASDLEESLLIGSAELSGEQITTPGDIGSRETDDDLWEDD